MVGAWLPACSGEEHERNLLLEAGAELSAWGANPRCLAFFGIKYMQQEQFYGTLEHIGKWGLPTFLSPDSATLKQNSHVLSTIYTRGEDVPHRRLVLAYDRTYLIATTQLVRTHVGSVLAGGAHRPPGWELPDESMFVLDRSKGDQQFEMKKGKRLERWPRSFAGIRQEPAPQKSRQAAIQYLQQRAGMLALRRNFLLRPIAVASSR